MRGLCERAPRILRMGAVMLIGLAMLLQGALARSLNIEILPVGYVLSPDEVIDTLGRDVIRPGVANQSACAITLPDMEAAVSRRDDPVALLLSNAPEVLDDRVLPRGRGILAAADVPAGKVRLLVSHTNAYPLAEDYVLRMHNPGEEIADVVLDARATARQNPIAGAFAADTTVGGALVRAFLDLERNGPAVGWRVVDGDRRSRLRVIDTATGRVRAELSVASRRGAVDGAPVARVSADGAWLFIDTVEGVWVFDVREAPVRTRVGSRLRDVRFAGGRGRALLGVSRQSALAFSLPDIRGGGVSSRAPVGFSDVIDTIALSSGTRLFSLAAVPPMRRLPALRPTASPTPNPALKEGAWRLSAWGPGQATPTVIDLVKRVDLEKCDGASRPRIAVSPDDRWLAIVHGRRAWVLRTDELTVQHEIFPPGLASGAAFSADGSQLLTVLDERLLCWRLANRSQRFLLDGQMRLPGPAQIATAPRPSFAVSGER